MPFNLGLGLGIQRGGYLFSPASLFTASEPGVIYDASDINTLFQDTAGTQPVTAAGQTVALALDKSKGLVLGPELVTNGDFSGGSTGWTLGTGWSIGSGVATKVAGTGSNLTQTIGAVAGRTYKITFTATVTAGAVAPNVGGLATVSISASGTYSQLLTATGSNADVRFFGNATFAGTIDNVSVRELSGNHATQSILASRPLYQVDASGRGYLSFDGIDDFLVTPTITPNTDKVQVFAGVRKLSDAAAGVVAEFSADASANNGSFWLVAPDGAGAATYNFRSRGTISRDAQATSLAAPRTNVLSGQGDISGDRATLRVNGTQVAQSTSDQGTGNYLAYPLYIGRRGGTLLPFNGHLYGLVVRFGPNLDAATIAATEAWMNTRTGAY